jgi:trehalose 6-phosphate phosphatase
MMSEPLPIVGSPLELSCHVLSQHPSAVVCDIDGTLSPIAPTPHEAVLGPGAREALLALTRTVDLVAAVTGRSAADAAVMVDVPEMLIVGNHGLEWMERGERIVHPVAVETQPRLETALAEIAARAADDTRLHGVIVENKELSGSVHYRLTSDPDYSYDRIVEWAKELALTNDLRVTEGRMVIELRPPIDVNKGAAIRRIIEERALMGLVFFGDDVTDMDGFRELARLRDTRNFAGLSIAVADPEARPEVVAAADTVVPGVTACVALLTELAEAQAEARS